jgi:hypothetical protein
MLRQTMVGHCGTTWFVLLSAMQWCVDDRQAGPAWLISVVVTCTHTGGR